MIQLTKNSNKIQQVCGFIFINIKFGVWVSVGLNPVCSSVLLDEPKSVGFEVRFFCIWAWLRPISKFGLFGRVQIHGSNRFKVRF